MQLLAVYRVDPIAVTFHPFPGDSWHTCITVNSLRFRLLPGKTLWRAKERDETRGEHS
jgi:hypothetical protein